MRTTAVLSLLLVTAACGDPGLDRGDPTAVFYAAAAAVHDGDWPTLETLLTKDARMEMERDLARVKKRLSHPDGGKREREIAAARLGARAAAEIQKVVEGGPSAALRFWMLINPRDRRPPLKGTQVGTLSRDIKYVTGDGTVRNVRLRRQGDEWYVADFQI